MGRWDPGGGKLEHGVSLEENVKREVQEEYGCDCEIIGRLPAHSSMRDQDNGFVHWLVVPFFVRVDREQVRINEPDKMDELRWAAIDDLPEPLHTGFADTLDRFRAHFEQYQDPDAKALWDA